MAELLVLRKINMAAYLKLRKKGLYKGNSDRQEETHTWRSEAGILLVVNSLWFGNDAHNE